MATYSITAPNGQSYTIDGPEGASDTDVQAEVLRQYPEAAQVIAPRGLDVGTVTDDSPLEGDIAPPVQPIAQPNPTYYEDMMAYTGNAVAGIGQGLAAIPDAATNALGAVMGEGAAMLGNGAGAALGAVGADDMGQKAAALGQYLKEQFYKPVTIGGEIEKVAPTPQDDAGKWARFAAQLMGGAMSVPGVTTLPKAMVKQAPKAAAVATTQQETLQAAQRVGLDNNLLPADTGGAVARMATAISGQMPGSAPFIMNAAKRLNTKAGDIVSREAASMGEAAIPQSAGEAALVGAEKWIKASSQIGSKLYKVAENLSEQIKVTPTNARVVLNEQIARLESVPGGGQGLAEAKQLRAAMDSDFSVQGIRDMRTEMFVSADLRGGPVEARMRAVTNAAAQDVVEGLTKAGKPEAAKAFAAADKYWAERLDTITKTLDPILGKSTNRKSGEEVIRSLNLAMQGKNVKLASFIRTLPDEEQGIVRASLLAPMGIKDGAFSLSRFSDDWAKIGDTAKGAVFTAESRAALNDVALIGRQAKAAMAYNNSSNTGRAAVGGGMVVAAVSSAAGLVTMGKALAAQGAVGLVLSSPKVARWIARAPRNGTMPQAYLQKLSTIAASQPTIRNDVLQLQARVADAFNAPMAAADDRTDTQ